MTKPWTAPTVDLLRTAGSAQSGELSSDFEDGISNPSGVPA